MAVFRRVVLGAVMVWTLVAAPGALGAPPANDARAAAESLAALPADVRASTVEATLDADEPTSGCGPISASVWYSVVPAEGTPIVVAFDAAGDLDAIVDVFVRRRSQVSPVTCQATNDRGAATFEFDAAARGNYLIRVGAKVNSVNDRFRLRVIEPDRPAQFPGPRLPRRGVSASVDRLANPDDAWSVRLRRGTAYRVNLVSPGRCAGVQFHPPGGADSVRSMSCDAHTVYVPPASGLHTLHVVAPRASRDEIPYRLQVGVALADDTAPGVPLPNDVRVRGGLRGNALDAIDLYRFSVARPSIVRLALRTAADFDLRLHRDTGRRLACDCGHAGGKELELRLGPGRYFVALRARGGAGGRYDLRRLARTVTRADTLVDGRAGASAAPGTAVDLELVVRPPVDGPAVLVVERFDPLVGWLFHATYRPTVRSGRAAVSFRAPSVGRWRVTGRFEGTRLAAPSEGGTAHLNVQEPLEGD